MVRFHSSAPKIVEDGDRESRVNTLASQTFFMAVDRSGFADSLLTHQQAFGLLLSGEHITRLTGYYELVQENNPVLHLVAPCTPEEFAVRHILESLMLLEHLPRNSTFADVGAGAGLPSIPCLLVRDDLKALLIESKERKAAFLEKAVLSIGIADRTSVVNRQFSETDPAGCDIITCRALDRFTMRVPRMLKWAGPRTMLLFGGKNLEHAIQEQRKLYSRYLMPLSDQRFLFVIN
ncbi:MAG TPA: RsmG family class I SAM-dependent methyltransferase [Pyrinomonadaceae bacterium]|nr:RsmG family class I SAM-dependent methyltransferase [Pyrinomonadaceae bacterium]